MQKLIPVAAATVLLATSGAFAQTPPTAPAEKMETRPVAPPMRQPTVQTPPKLSEPEAKALIDAAVITSDNKTVGEVYAIQRDNEGKVIELQADIGGFLGIGETRVRLLPSQFTVSNKRIILTLTAEQVNALPRIESK